jgi:predicted short-subunit dehydrogenase-like oxidoreductase (DUF2520 family)
VLYLWVMDITIVGIGRVGGALAIALNNAGFNVRQLIVRDQRPVNGLRAKDLSKAQIDDWNSLTSIESELIIIATADTDIFSAVEGLVPFVQSGQIVLHTSGARTADELSALKVRGCETGSIHPLTSISDPISGAKQFRGSYFCVEGSRQAVTVANQLVRSLGGNSFTIKGSRKALYHAAAVMAAGHLTALFDCSLEMLSVCGISKGTGVKILLPLVRSTLHNLERQSPEAALTGTFSRLDRSTLEKHIEAFDGVSNEILLIYLLLGERSLEIVERTDHDAIQLEKVRRSISIAKESFR